MAERKIIVNGGSDNARERASGDLYAHVSQTLWAEKDTGTTAGTAGPETMYTYSLLANTLSANESSISMVFNGVFAATANDKYIRLMFNGTQISLENAYTNNNTAWQMTAHIMRASNSILECTVTTYRHSSSPDMKYTEISSLNLSATEYDMTLELETPDAVGDVSVHNGRIMFHPAP
jgi:hypothetical protein